MSLIIKCPITGAAFRLPMFSSSHSPHDPASCHVVTAPHPLLATPIAQLSVLPFPTEPAERHILLCAWLEKLAQTGIVRWCGVLNPVNFSSRWYVQQFDQFTTLALWLIANSNHPAHSAIPQLSITAALDSDNLQTWRESAQTIIASYSTFFDSAETLRLREAQAAAAILQDSLGDEYKSDNSILLRAKQRRSYVHASLLFHSQQDQVDTVLRVLSKPYNFELALLQQVKAFCLDFLPENGHENYNDKQEVVALLDAAILDRVGMAQLLGCSTAEQDKEARTISAQYTTQAVGVDGIQTFVTASNPKVAAAINRSTQDALSKANDSIPHIASEPKIEDYRHRILFDAATRLWKAQQATIFANLKEPIMQQAVGDLI